jgi:hypothetical protein
MSDADDGAAARGEGTRQRCTACEARGAPRGAGDCSESTGLSRAEYIEPSTGADADATESSGLAAADECVSIGELAAPCEDAPESEGSGAPRGIDGAGGVGERAAGGAVGGVVAATGDATAAAAAAA